MAYATFVRQTSTTEGTGNFTLASALGWRTFNEAHGTGSSNKFRYAIRHRGSLEWETGTGYMSDSTTLVRETVEESSNAGAAVNFSSGTKEVANAFDATILNQIIAYLGNGVLTAPSLGVVAGTFWEDANATLARVRGSTYVATAGEFTAGFTGFTVNVAGAAGTAHWGAFWMLANAAGVPSTDAVSANQDYATEAAAIAALPAVSESKAALGYMTVQTKSGLAWVGGTDDLVEGSDCTDRNFYNADVLTLPSPI
jgi:hypothetical protein